MNRGLVRVNNTIEGKRVILARFFFRFFTWVYVLYAVHDKMKSHTGEAVSKGYRIINGK